ncbi:MAG: YdjC family protein [Gemmatimonadetes bacterium]|nr:YdjC family protein [Gemmatimonadota bacterium]
MQTPPRLLVVNADDLGFAPGVNRGILEAHLAGTVSSASMMVNTPAFADAVEMVQTSAPRLGVGLHLNLLCGEPLSAVPSLVDPATGALYALDALATRALAGLVDAADVRRECDAQLAALKSAGITPTHVDSHRHAHALPGILPAVVASARDAGVHIVRRPLDHPTLLDPIAGAKMLVLHAAWRAALRGVPPVHRELLARAPHFRGIALQGAPDVRERLLAMLDLLPRGATEIMLHPGYDDAVLAEQDPYRKERETEVAALCDRSVRARLDRDDIRLVHFGEIT